MNDPKLKPYPCCGSIEAVVEQHYNYEADDYGNKTRMGVVKCLQCRLKMEAGSKPKYAIERWNRRVPVSALLEACKEAEQELITFKMKDEKMFGRGRYYEQMEAEEAWSETVYKIREAVKLAGGEK